MPKVWYVLYNTEQEFNLISDYYGKGWKYYPSNNDKGYCSGGEEWNNWVDLNQSNAINKERLEDLNAVQISFEEWKKIFIDNESVPDNDIKQEPEDFTYLIEFIKKIEECQK